MRKALAFVLVSFLLVSVYGQDTVFYKYNALPASNMQEALSYGILERDEVDFNQVIETKFTADKRIVSRTFYKDFNNRVKHGQQMFWSEDSKLAITKQYRYDSLHGFYREYTPEGKLAREKLFNYNRLIKDTLLISEKLDSINIVDNLSWFEFDSIFLGCEDIEDEEQRNKCTEIKMQEHISLNTKYPKEVKDAGYTGRIVVSFVINEVGEVSKIKIIESVKFGKELEEEAIRVIMSLPKMTPATAFGESCRIQYTVPINFKLDSKGSRMPLKAISNASKAEPQEQEQAQEQEFKIVEDLPVWPTCTTEVGRLEKEQCTNLAMMNFVQNAVQERYPSELKNQNIGGRAFCRFMVNEVGNVEDVIVVKSVGNATLDSIAKDIILSFPRLAPATQDGKPVKVQYTVPVNFK